MYSFEDPEVEVQMLIRRPVAEVFAAFTDPEITTRFWFTRSSGELVAGKSVIWEWEMYQVKDEVEVLEVIPNERISILWSDPRTKVDIIFEVISKERTYVVIKNYGLNMEGDDLISAVRDLTGGFTTVLDGLKAYLEHGIQLGLIADKFLR